VARGRAVPLLLPHVRALRARGGRGSRVLHPDRGARGRGARQGHPGAAHVALPSLHQLLVLRPPVLEPDLHLSLGDAKACGQLCSLWQREILGPLEPSLQLLDLQRGVYRAWLPDLLPLSIDSSDQLAMFYNTVSFSWAWTLT